MRRRMATAHLELPLLAACWVAWTVVGYRAVPFMLGG